MKKSLFFLQIFLFSILFFGKMNAQTTNIFCDDFEAGSLNSTFWATNVSTNGIVAPSQTNANSGSFSLQMGKSSDNGSFQTQQLDLKLNLAGFSDKNVYLSFFIFDQSDETQVEDGIFLSNNGGASFVKIQDFKPADWCDFAYGQLPPLDLTAIGKANFGAGWATNQIVIRFQQRDDGDFGNGGSVGADGFFLDDICVFERPVLFAKILPNQPFLDDFETGGLSNFWTWRSAEKTNTLAALPSRPSNFSNIWGNLAYNSAFSLLLAKRCDDGFATNAMDLQLDLSMVSQVELLFWIYNQSDETQADDGLYFSNDGGATFKKALDFKPSEYCDFSWGQFPPIDVDELAAKLGLNLTANFIIRFQQHDDGDLSNGGSTGADGLFFDDINVRVPKNTFATLPLFEDFETGNLRDMWANRWADGQTATLVPVPTRPSNFGNVQNGFAFNSQYSLLFAKRCDDGFATNAVDLRLNLTPGSQVEMTFWMYDQSDETQTDDGIYFSNDGGVTFAKAFSFDPSNWCDFDWGHFPPLDIDELALNLDLGLTSNFVIRFQQHDDGDLSNGGSSGADGFYIDDVRVYETPTKYAPVPFFDDFETGKFGTAWSNPFAEKILPNVPPTFTRLSNAVEVSNNNGQNSQYGVLFAKRCDDGFATNALDLHLNLVGASDIKLMFDLKSWDDEKHPEDGVFFSNDAGKTFKKVFNFAFDLLPAFQWQVNFPQSGLNVDAMAAANGLAFTKNFVIRFQQHDDGDLNNGGSIGADGMILDNINLTATTPTTAIFEKNRPKSVKIWPNPTSNRIKIELPEIVFGEKMNWQLLDAQGKLLKNGAEIGSNSTFEIDLDGFQNGVYLLILKAENGVWQQRICKF
jgi:Secretion system C-terminal sorting domain